MGETLSLPDIPDWMAREVAAYDLPLASPPVSVLDLGANIGAFALLAHQRWPAAVVHAYEPLAAPVTRFPNLHWHAAAVRRRPGRDEILIGDRSVTCGFHQLGRQTDQRQMVDCVGAHQLPACEFVKIDTEGCEVEILDGLDLSATKVLCVEYHRVEDAERIAAIATAAGLEHYREEPLGPTWGLLIFARPGAILGGASVPASRDIGGRLVSSLAPAKTKLFLALPVYGALDVYFTQSLLKLINDPPGELMLRMNPGDSLVARARNTLTADFLESDATHLLFIDTDLIFSRDHVAQLLAHDEDIVGGFYPKKQAGPTQWVCNALPVPPPPQPDGLQAVAYMGTGFLKVARRVFEVLIQKYGAQLRYRPDHRDRVEYDFWSVGPYQYPDGRRRYLSEDWFFCQRAMDAGYTVWGDTRIELQHVGQAIYPLGDQATGSTRPTDFGGVIAADGTPGTEAIRPSSSPALSSRAATAGHCAARGSDPAELST